MPVRVHVPVTVRVTGELSAERRDLLRRAVTRIVAARLAAAERTLAERGHGAHEVLWPPSGDDRSGGDRFGDELSPPESETRS
ncbi:hypothetical protein [Actinomadura rupiterrae]|uniref:hypothetical protein n=1 Tax=Actinomadura rupiterrae TaxID=559627 RepID=UPI0020A2A0D6|nr:hypothetical protein [Actinomadura rupiterrae]MCP2341332.1 GMP synthase PP-ATPase subunit [Actinomadura rupiterrae]